jgi:hypothetical protein
MTKRVLEDRAMGRSTQGAWMETRSGNRFYPEHPEVSTYAIGDIAHALSLLCRFAGQGDRFYSVAQHSVEVSRASGHEPRLRKQGLLHDASEAYLVDLPSPIKYLPEMKPYRELEARVMAAIRGAFGLPYSEPPEVKYADLRLCRAEAKMLGLLRPDWGAIYDMPPLDHKFRALSPEYAERQFLAEWRKLEDA